MNDTLFAKKNDTLQRLVAIPDIVLGRKALTANYLSDSLWLLGFANGQIIKSTDQGLTWDTCAYMTELAGIRKLWKDDFGVYFDPIYKGFHLNYKIISPSIYRIDHDENIPHFKHKGKHYKIKWSNLYVLDSLAQKWTELYHFPISKLFKTKNELFFYGSKNNNHFIFKSIDGGLNWQIISTPFPISTLVATKSQWFAFNKDDQKLNLSNDWGQSWINISIDSTIDTIYAYQNNVFLIGSQNYYSWDKKNTSWVEHPFTYPMTDYNLDEFLLFRRSSIGDSLFQFAVTDLVTSESRPVLIPPEFKTKKDWNAPFEHGAADYQLDKGKIYICDKYHRQGIKYATCEAADDTLFIQAQFCPEEGYVLGDTTLLEASTDTIQFMDNFHTPSVAILDISPFDALPIIQKDTTVNIGDLIAGQKIYKDTILLQYFNNQYGCDDIIQWNISILVSTFSPIANDIAIYPNPSTGEIFLKSDHPFKNIQLRVINIMGQTIYTQKVNADATLDLSFLPKGYYNLIFTKKDKKSCLPWVKI